MMDNGKLVITKNDLTDIANFFFPFLYVYLHRKAIAQRGRT